MAANTGANLKGLRDRALLLIGFAGALRRSELVALNIEDIEEAPDGMKITIGR
jgi:site-specific recombinase XerD